MLEFHRDAGIVNSYLHSSWLINDWNMAWLCFWQHDTQEAVIVDCLNLFCTNKEGQLERQDKFAEVDFHLVEAAAFIRILTDAPDNQFSTV
jgi:hypothetical protein